MAALQKQADSQLKAMLLLLHGHLQTRHVSKAQRRDLSQMVADLLLQTEHLQDPELLALFDLYYSKKEQAQWAQDDAEDIQALRDLVQATFAADEQPDLPDDPDALMALLMQRIALNKGPGEGQAQPTRRKRRKTPANNKPLSKPSKSCSTPRPRCATCTGSWPVPCTPTGKATQRSAHAKPSS
jgi:hypothetical protein